jgi:uncharacterized membrane protein
VRHADPVLLIRHQQLKSEEVVSHKGSGDLTGFFVFDPDPRLLRAGKSHSNAFMTDSFPNPDRITLAMTLFFAAAGIVCIPAAIGIIGNIPLHIIFGFVGSILIFQPVAVAVGIGLGIPPLPVMLIMLSIGISVIFVLFGTCDIFAGKSAWLRNHLDQVDTIAKKSSLFQRYGILTIIPFIWVPGVGLYGCVLLAWLFRWRGVQGISIILAGWMLASLLVLLTSLGIMGLLH